MGRATALTFGREGASVVGCDVAVQPAETTIELVQAAGGEMVSLQPCRLSDPTDCAKLVELAMNEFGRIDVLFNLAGKSHFAWIEDVTTRTGMPRVGTRSTWCSTSRVRHGPT
jgi:NAD(P)-dependent dehydrogenase (short-subunit alcohol dehydrogenase family)